MDGAAVKPIHDSTGARVRHYSRSTATDGRGKRRTTPNDDPEHRFQCEVVEALTWAVPDDYKWTANAAGVRVSMHVAKKMKAAGVRRGWPDLQILFPSAVTRYIELKVKAGLSTDQEDFRDACLATGRDIWALCRTLDEVEVVLRRWNVPLKMPLRRANRYGA